MTEDKSFSRREKCGTFRNSFPKHPAPKQTPRHLTTQPPTAVTTKKDPTSKQVCEKPRKRRSDDQHRLLSSLGSLFLQIFLSFGIHAVLFLPLSFGNFEYPNVSLFIDCASADAQIETIHQLLLFFYRPPPSFQPKSPGATAEGKEVSGTCQDVNTK